MRGGDDARQLRAEKEKAAAPMKAESPKQPIIQIDYSCDCGHQEYQRGWLQWWTFLLAAVTIVLTG
jgi:hypothetical protein